MGACEGAESRAQGQRERLKISKQREATEY